jgi:Rrf2 family protein
MLKLSAKSEYALLLVRYLLDRQNQRHSLTQIAQDLSISETLLRKITSDIVRAGICTSLKGRLGGIQIAHSDVMVYDVLGAVGEDLSVALCTESSCTKESSCRISPTLKRIQRGMEALLKITRV